MRGAQPQRPTLQDEVDPDRDLQRDVQKQAPWVITFQAQAQVALREEVKGFIHGPVNDLILYRGVTKN